MQKLLLLFTATLMTCTQIQAQIIPASGTEFIYPGPDSGAVHRTVHTSAYNMLGTFEGQEYELQAWAWNASHSQHSSGIAWRNINTGNNAMTQGHFVAPYEDLPVGARDIEVAIYYEGSQPYLIAAYYNEGVASSVPSGHYFNIYRWSLSGLGFVSMTQISTAENYGRISIDAFKGFALAITWEEEGKIMVKTGYSGGGTMQFSDNIVVSNTDDAIIPDVALGHVASGDKLNVLITYMEQDPGNPGGGIIDVISHDFYSLHGTTTGVAGFTDEDQLNIGSYNYNPWYYTGTFNAYSLQLDCPEYSVKGHWSYVYQSEGHIRARTYNSGSGGITSSILDLPYPSPIGINTHPTIAYSGDGTNIYYGWVTHGLSGFNGKYIATVADLGATPLSYMYVANGDTASLAAIMTFAKGTAYTGHLFCAFPEITNGQYYMVTKTKDWSAGSFKPGITGISEAQAEQASVIAYPNPFRDGFQLLIGQGKANGTFHVTLTDIMGKAVRQVNGSVATVNKELHNAGAKLPKGVYMLQVKGGDVDQNIKLLKH